MHNEDVGISTEKLQFHHCIDDFDVEYIELNSNIIMLLNLINYFKIFVTKKRTILKTLS